MIGKTMAQYDNGGDRVASVQQSNGSRSMNNGIG
jgi:hypothetical protein